MGEWRNPPQAKLTAECLANAFVQIEGHLSRCGVVS
jgi:hypothetical protein